MNDKNEKMTGAEITEALNRVYDSPQHHRMDEVLQRLQWLTLGKAEW